MPVCTGHCPHFYIHIANIAHISYNDAKKINFAAIMDKNDLRQLKNKYGIIGEDPALNTALGIAVSIAPADELAVLVRGESGVGKDVIAKIIHDNSPRKGRKYIPGNCGAIAEGLVDSELFGHEKGAFTSAIETRKGYFEEADGGTLFLDEIGELPLASQAKLLRVLQSGEYMRVGSSKVMKTDVRVVAATNRNLWHLVSQGKFREDLYWRLNNIQITIPALRERPDDIHLLFRKFVSDITERHCRTRPVLTPDAVALLTSYRWPGNIRQLKAVSETLAMLESMRATPGSSGIEVSAEVLAKYIPVEEGNTLPVPLTRESSISSDDKELILKYIFSIKQELEELKQAVYGDGAGRRCQPALPHILPGSGIEPEEQPDEQSGIPEEGKEDDFSIRKDNDEKIRQALKAHSSKRKAAEALGISERTLYRWLKEHQQEQ